MDKRNAVILTGFAREYQFCFSDFLENLITSDNVDVFIATWNYVGVKAEYVSEQTITLTNNKPRDVKLKVSVDDSQIDIDDIREKYNPTDIKVFDEDLFIESIEQYAKIVESYELKLKSKAQHPGFCHHTLMRRYSIFYMSYQGWKLMERHAEANNITYEKVIKARFDWDRGGYYPKINWDKEIADKTIMIGGWNLQPYSNLDQRIPYDFQDHFALGNYKDMFYYFNMFNNLFKLTDEFKHRTKKWHAEYCLSLWLHMNKITCKVIKGSCSTACAP